jgi:hypothetical protein
MAKGDKILEDTMPGQVVNKPGGNGNQDDFHYIVFGARKPKNGDKAFYFSSDIPQYRMFLEILLYAVTTNKTLSLEATEENDTHVLFDDIDDKNCKSIKLKAFKVTNLALK